jgi:hypothetical protein
MTVEVKAQLGLCDIYVEQTQPPYRRAREGSSTGISRTAWTCVVAWQSGWGASSFREFEAERLLQSEAAGT